jgi:hypothetical protein
LLVKSSRQGLQVCGWAHSGGKAVKWESIFCLLWCVPRPRNETAHPMQPIIIV